MSVPQVVAVLDEVVYAGNQSQKVEISVSNELGIDRCLAVHRTMLLQVEHLLTRMTGPWLRKSSEIRIDFDRSHCSDFHTDCACSSPIPRSLRHHQKQISKDL